MRDEAASNPLAFVVAGSLIIGIIGLALTTTGMVGGPSTRSSSDAAISEVRADGLLGLLVQAPNQPGRLGLKADSGPGLDIETFRELQLTKFTKDASNVLLYDTVRSSMGIEGSDFHLRSYPTLHSVRQQLGAKDMSLEVAYIGHAGTRIEGGAPAVIAPACEQSKWGDADSIRFEVKVTNQGASNTQFQLVLSIDNGPGKSFTIRDQTGLLAPGQAETVGFEVPHTAETACTPTTAFSVTVYGPDRRLEKVDFAAPAATTTPPSAAGGLTLAIPSMHVVSGGDLAVEYTADKDDTLTWTLYSGVTLATSTVVAGCNPIAPQACTGSFTVPNKGSQFTIKVPTVATATGYTLVVHHTQHGATATQRVLVEAADGDVQPYEQLTGTSSFAFDDAMVIEVDYLDRLMGQFAPGLFSVAEGPAADWEAKCLVMSGDDCDPWDQDLGDVFWDQKKILTENFPDRIGVNADCTPKVTNVGAFPDIVVVGSNVDHNAMTSGPFKEPLRDWVVCGGLLIVFGSPEASTQWLQPIFHVGAQSTSTGGIAAPDQTHPLLRVPHQLDFQAYENHDRTWRYTANAGDHFTNIVNQGGDPITAISDPGDFGRGTVLISNWLPYDVFGTGPGSAPLEGLNIMDNFVTQAYRDLFLDYGPAIPSGAPVLPAIRQSQIELSNDFGDPNYHPMCKAVATCHVDMTVLLYLF